MSYLIITKKKYTCAMRRDRVSKQEIKEYEQQGFKVSILN